MSCNSGCNSHLYIHTYIHTYIHRSRVGEGDEKGGESATYSEYSPQSPGEGGRIPPAAGGGGGEREREVLLTIKN
jgi:hypothetical protein